MNVQHYIEINIDIKCFFSAINLHIFIKTIVNFMIIKINMKLR